jgi:hypothetical protein
MRTAATARIATANQTFFCGHEPEFIARGAVVPPLAGVTDLFSWSLDPTHRPRRDDASTQRTSASDNAGQ